MRLGNRLRDWLRDYSKDHKYFKLGHEPTRVTLNPKIFGNDIHANSIPAVFLFAAGGIGDYLNWCASVYWVSKHFTHVDGYVFGSDLMLPVLKYYFGDTPRWKIEDRHILYTRDPEPSKMLVERLRGQFLNPCGEHLMNLGFNHHCNISPPPPDYNFLIPIDYEGEWKWPELDPNSNYAVFTPGATQDIRALPVEGFNELVRYALTKGVTPVFLGKRELGEAYAAKFQGYDFTKGVDLRERTNLLEAAQVMRRAKFVVGLDNGLLHLAGTTNVPVIFGMNVTAIPHRDLRRKAGLTVNVTVSEELLACIGCQSRMRFISPADFRKCFFDPFPDRSRKCLTLLIKDRCAVWVKAIDYCLERGDKHRGNAKNTNLFIK